MCKKLCIVLLHWRHACSSAVNKFLEFFSKNFKNIPRNAKERASPFFSAPEKSKPQHVKIQLQRNWLDSTYDKPSIEGLKETSHELPQVFESSPWGCLNFYPLRALKDWLPITSSYLLHSEVFYQSKSSVKPWRSQKGCGCPQLEIFSPCRVSDWSQYSHLVSFPQRISVTSREETISKPTTSVSKKKQN